jgi:hypothetical protein
MGLSAPVLDFDINAWLSLFGQKLLKEVDSIIQVVGVHVSRGNMELAVNLARQRLPVRLQVLIDVIMVSPKLGCFLVDLA